MKVIQDLLHFFFKKKCCFFIVALNFKIAVILNLNSINLLLLGLVLTSAEFRICDEGDHIGTSF